MLLFVDFCGIITKYMKRAKGNWVGSLSSMKRGKNMRTPHTCLKSWTTAKKTAAKNL